MNRLRIRNAFSAVLILFALSLLGCAPAETGGSGRNGSRPATPEEEWALRVIDPATVDELILAWKEIPESLKGEFDAEFTPIDDSLERSTQADLAYWYTFAFFGSKFASARQDHMEGRIGSSEANAIHTNVARMMLGLPTLGVDEQLIELVHRLSNQMIAMCLVDMKWSKRYEGWSGLWNSSSATWIKMIEGAPPADKSQLAILRQDQAEYEQVMNQFFAYQNEIQTMRHVLSKKHNTQFPRVWDADLVTNQDR